MSLLVFPSQNKPQFYISNDTNVIIYFIYNFLFSGKLKIQLLINIIKSILPNSLLSLLLKCLLKTEPALPAALSETLNSIKAFVSKNRDSFQIGNEICEDIHFIIRISTWQRVNDKFVIILFIHGNHNPFAVVKVGSLQYTDSIELEYSNTKAVYHKFQNNSLISIPNPIALYKSDKMVAYFERSIDGLPVNHYLKLPSYNRSEQSHYIYILNTCKDFLIQLSAEKEPSTTTLFTKFFLTPIEAFEKSESGGKYSIKLDQLRAEADKLQGKHFHLVCMHGDLWGGSILYNDKKIGIIDWEFLTFNGVPFWDFYSIAFHAGEGVNKIKFSKLADFMIYFNNSYIAQEVDKCLLELAKSYKLDISAIPFLFQSYLLFNIQHRDTSTENYWQDCLEYYWNLSETKQDNMDRLL